MEAKQILSDRMASLGALAAGLAHEVNNPLASVMANLELAQEDLSELGSDSALSELVSDMKEKLINARESAARVRQILSDIKLFTSSEEAHCGPVDVRRVIDCVLRLARNEVRYRTRVSRHFDDVPTVRGTEQDLSHAFLNIVVRLAQSIEEGPVDAHEMSIAIRHEDAHVIVEFTAPLRHGVSLREAIASFPALENEVGVSLVTSRTILESVGAGVDVWMSPTNLTHVRISLPADSAHEFDRTTEPDLTVPCQRRGHVLVVVDEALDALVIRRALASEHDVESVDSTSLALEHIKWGERFDLILCDLMMSPTTGVEFYKQIDGLDPHQARGVVFLVGGPFTTNAREFLETNQNARLDKPYDVTQLRCMVRKQLSKRERHD